MESPSWSGFSIPLPWGQLPVRAYALCILAGIVVGLWLTAVRWKHRGGNPGTIVDIGLWAVVFGIVGGRLYHVFTTPGPYFGPDGDLGAIFRIWDGGLGIWGAVALGALGAWIGCRLAGVRFSAFVDAVAPGVLLAQALGRWGNYFNQELFGAPTTLPWGLRIDPDNPSFPATYPPDTLFHPTFLYESLWSLLGVVILLLLDRRLKLRGGQLAALYIVYYTFGRLWIEMLRIDQAQQITIGGLSARLNVWTSLVVLCGAIVLLIVVTRRRKNRPGDGGIYLPGRTGQADRTAAETTGTSGTSQTRDRKAEDAREASRENPAHLPSQASEPGHEGDHDEEPGAGRDILANNSARSRSESS